MSNYAILIRRESDNKQTLGHFTLFKKGKVDVLFSCYMLELDDDCNRVRKSRIPKGKYTVVKRYSRKFGKHYHVKDVENRSLILIHPGNYFSDILGCLLPGDEVSDINADGHRDVVRSKSTMNELNLLAGNEFQLEIIDREI